MINGIVFQSMRLLYIFSTIYGRTHSKESSSVFGRIHCEKSLKLKREKKSKLKVFLQSYTEREGYFKKLSKSKSAKIVLSISQSLTSPFVAISSLRLPKGRRLIWIVIIISAHSAFLQVPNLYFFWEKLCQARISIYFMKIFAKNY